ncbi:multidrug effflux MFS transporter [Listeria marthii]|uniref:multidrug effflux MFS transporter n=1 Tax=Listeria marthii TaxID=529731 RepID=UPI001889620F|nr:multidrug effflux MFS transporter [Listeria marthii]MBF2362711.1 multidrug effflux MFS transporter [Listeria marthii]MBF2537150.1 multidrug effflux MFS transporter [Listeria marthii]
MEKNIETKKINLALLVCLVGFPQISETIYTPSLTEIATSYGVSLNLAQMTLSIYFLAFAVGVFFWGVSSDFLGRRKAMNFGIFIYIIGCLVCLMSNSITVLFIGRFIQAFGASTGSVTTQTILRDNYHGTDRHHLFAKISAALAFSPAIGPLVGGFIGQYYGFRVVFLFLVMMGMGLLFWSLKRLPETIIVTSHSFSAQKMVGIGKKMVGDRYTVAFGVLIGIFNGILFSYYSEAPTIFIEKFHFSQSQYGFMGCVVAAATILGAWLSNRRLKQHSPQKIITEGILLALGGTLSLSIVSVFPLIIQVIAYILFICIILVGIGMALPNCLSLALVKFQEVAGTAGAFLSLGYYVIVSICTFLIGILHSGSLFVFPAFCTVLLLIALTCIKAVTRKNS